MGEVSDVQQPFALWLKQQGIPFIQARSDRESTIAVGWPDFTICLHSHVILIEAKFGKGSLSVAQKRCHETLEKAGCKVHVVRKIDAAIALVEEFRSILKRWGVDEPKVERKTPTLTVGNAEWVPDGRGGFSRADMQKAEFQPLVKAP